MIDDLNTAIITFETLILYLFIYLYLSKYRYLPTYFSHKGYVPFYKK